MTGIKTEATGKANSGSDTRPGPNPPLIGKMTDRYGMTVREAGRNPALDQDAILAAIMGKMQTVRKVGLRPVRVYMSNRTRWALDWGVFHSGLLTVVPRGTNRVLTVCGMDIRVCDDIPDGCVDVVGEESW